MVTHEFERDFYEVYTDGDSKYVRILGWLEERDDHITVADADSRCTFKVGEQPRDMTFPEYTRYERDYGWDEEDEISGIVESYFDGSSGKHLAMRSVTESTPDGNYWCYFEEE